MQQWPAASDLAGDGPLQGCSVPQQSAAAAPGSARTASEPSQTATQHVHKLLFITLFFQHKCTINCLMGSHLACDVILCSTRERQGMTGPGAVGSCMNV